MGFLMVFLMVLFGGIHDRNCKHVQRLMSNLFSLIKTPNNEQMGEFSITIRFFLGGI